MSVYMLPVSSVVPLGTAMLSPVAIVVKNCGTGSGGFKRGNRCAGGGKPGTEAGNKAMLASMSDDEAIRWRGVLDAARRVRSAVIKSNGCTDGYCESAAASLAKELIMNHDEEPKVASGHFRSDGSVPDFDDPEGYHHWVEVGGKVVDPTADQFDKSISDVLIVDVGDKRYTRSGFSTHLTDPWIKKRDQLREEEKSLGGVAWSKNCGIGSGGFQQGNTCARGGSGGGAAGGPKPLLSVDEFMAVASKLPMKTKIRVSLADGTAVVGRVDSRALDGSSVSMRGKLEGASGQPSSHWFTAGKSPITAIEIVDDNVKPKQSVAAPKPAEKKPVAAVQSPAAVVVSKDPEKAALSRAQLEMTLYKDFKEFSDPSVNSAGKRWQNAALSANSMLASVHAMQSQNWEVKLVDVAKVKPNQSGDDYVNDSSKYTAETLRKLNKIDKKVLTQGEDDPLSAIRLEDMNPIAIKKDGGIVDGNHRHAAATMNGETKILAFVPVGPGDGKIVNMKEAFEALKSGKAPPSANAPKGPKGRKSLGDDAWIKNCGTGDGGFKPGNTCSKGGGSVGPGGYGFDTRMRYREADGRYYGDRFELHRQIIKDTIGDSIPVKNPVATFLGGGTASGKSSLLKSGKAGGKNAVVVDPDAIKEQIPEYQKWKSAGNKGAASNVHLESVDVAKAVSKVALKKGHHVVVDRVGDTGMSYLQESVDKARAAGATKVVAHYTTTDVGTALARAKERAEQTGRYVPQSYIKESHANVARILPDAMRSSRLFDEATLWDTTNGLVKVASSVSGKMEIHNQELWDRFVGPGRKRDR